MRKWLLCAAAVLLMMILLIPPAGRAPTTGPLRHGVWLDRTWLRVTTTEAELSERLRGLEAAGVRFLFIHAGPFNPDGSVPAYDPARVALIRRLAPADMQVIAWLGGRTEEIDLDQPAFRHGAGATAAALVAAGFDGVQLNIEPLTDGNPGFLGLLADVRADMPAGAFLGAATSLWGPGWLPNPRLFGDEYLREIARRVDQIAVMNYDSYMPSPALYQRVAAAQTRAALAAAQSRPGCGVLIGAPAYPSEGGMRHLAIAENLAAALRGIDVGLSRAPSAERASFTGVAIYAGWTATADDWERLAEWHRCANERRPGEPRPPLHFTARSSCPGGPGTWPSSPGAPARRAP